MKKTTFSVDTDRYKSRGHGSLYSTVQAFTYTSDGLEDYHFTINTFDNSHWPFSG